MSNDATAKFARADIEREIIAILTDMTADWDIDSTEPVNPETSLMADLSFESIDVVQLVVAIETKFGRGQLHFEQLLMSDGRYVEELQVKQIVDFLDTQLNK